MTKLLEIDHITGGYTRDKAVLNDVAFNVGNSEIVGLIGLNGAGKSTTIRHILGLMAPTSGEVRINGTTFLENRETYRSQLAFIPETPVLYDQLTLWEHLELAAMAYNLDEKTFKARVQPLLKEFNMENKTKWFPGLFSKGMRQKVMIMCAFLVRPDLYIVDEPIVGLDPLGIQSFLDLVLEMKANGAGVLMSTHILSTAEQYCDRFVILHEGHIVMKGTLVELQQQAGKPDATLHDIYVGVSKGEH